MKLKTLSDETLEYVKYIEWQSSQRRHAIEITKKLTKPAAKELNLLFSSFGGLSIGKQVYKFTYKCIAELELAYGLGYYPNAIDNVCLLPDSVFGAMFHNLELGQNILVPFAGYGAIANNLPSDKYINVLYNNGLEDLVNAPQAKDETTYDTILMRPPFSAKQDIEAILKMYDRLNVGGKLHSFFKRDIMWSAHNDAMDFRNFLRNTKHEIIKVDPLWWTVDGQIDVNYIEIIKEN